MASKTGLLRGVMKFSKVTPAAIAGSSVDAVAAGERIARLGGNAVDIAVAAALTATVSEIVFCSLGGSGYMMLRLPGRKAELIDGGDAVPSIAFDPDRTSWRSCELPYGDGVTVGAGHASVAVPGLLAALETAWGRHGSLPWRVLVEPAIETAKEGFTFGATGAHWLQLTGHILFHDQRASRECFFPNGIDPVQAGEHFRIPHIADTLELVARDGAAAFYQGDLGEAFAAEMRDNGGRITFDDLRSYEAVVRKPLIAKSSGFHLALNPPPAVGGAVAGSLIGLSTAACERPMADALWARQQARTQAVILQLREQRITQGGFDRAAAQSLLEPEWIRQNLAAMNSPHTTHLSVATRDGTLVSLTMSNGYGSGITIPGTGIACNNGLGEPELNPQGFAAAAAGSRLTSNMAPMVAWHDDGRAMAIGSPGAGRITTAIAQTWCRLVIDGMPPHEAVEAPRLHVERWDDGLRVQCEPGIETNLLQREFIIRPFENKNMFFGAVKLASVNAADDLTAVADRRREGATAIVE